MTGVRSRVSGGLGEGTSVGRGSYFVPHQLRFTLVVWVTVLLARLTSKSPIAAEVVVATLMLESPVQL
jgi:hypothetical protein